MEKIASFTINHDLLTPGMYVSRVDGDVVTYDLRLKFPNRGDYLTQGTLHTLEHLIATYARSSNLSDRVIYFGPMGCRTGFYLLLRDRVSKEEANSLTRVPFAFAAPFQGEVPGAKAIECGNYREHDLSGAQAEAEKYLEVLRDWSPEKMVYPA